VIGTQLVLIGAAYLGGSLPWGYWAARLARIDIRQHGSGNTGATNVWRVLGPRYGAPVLALDMAKGFVPALIAGQVAGPGTAVLAGSAAVIGHTFPVFLGFGGGKGVATSSGVAIALTPLLAVIFAIVLVVILWLFRYVSLASMLTAILYAAACILTGQPWPIIAFAGLAAFSIVVRHRANIRRLVDGTEAKAKTFGRGATKQGAV
jgi:acyl phosphate:glycerol-3-phosphate acyltransferase